MRAQEVTDTPSFEHDCPACTFLGRYQGADLYHCLIQGPRLPTVIARHSSSPPDYSSGLPAADYDERLHEARERARTRGLKIDLCID